MAANVQANRQALTTPVPAVGTGSDLDCDIVVSLGRWNEADRSAGKPVADRNRRWVLGQRDRIGMDRARKTEIRGESFIGGLWAGENGFAPPGRGPRRTRYLLIWSTDLLSFLLIY